MDTPSRAATLKKNVFVSFVNRRRANFSPFQEVDPISKGTWCREKQPGVQRKLFVLVKMVVKFTRYSGSPLFDPVDAGFKGCANLTCILYVGGFPVTPTFWQTTESYKIQF